ncbi:leucine-rich repeat-containing protein Bf66946-like [Branchiostoma lanceolatum]|uniref:leucine-rich repeat-containing protein Bf66946-like n=1 Tax=Branchiostoma lanceolatum TaxID=7740 RepID=UPI003456F9C8
MGPKEVFLISATLLAMIMAQEDNTCPALCDCENSHGEMTVTCGGQGLNQVPAGIPTSTIWLVLKYNNLARIGSHDFKGLRQLKGIDLSNNKIKKISRGALRHLVHLDNIDLSGNALHVLSEETFAAPLAAARQDGRRFFVFLANNPWRCDCHLKWLAEKYANATDVYSERLVFCNSPDNLNGSYVSDVPLSDFKCDPEVTFVDAEQGDDAATPKNDPRVESGSSKPLSKGATIATIFVVAVAVLVALLIMGRIGKEYHAGKQDTGTDIETRPMIPTDNREVYM